MLLTGAFCNEDESNFYLKEIFNCHWLPVTLKFKNKDLEVLTEI